jgi:hypothetical protein
MQVVQNKAFDEERAFYGSRDIKIIECKFDGQADGESAFKESANIDAENCLFNLRYPFWHDDNVHLNNCEITVLCRAAFWYTRNVSVENSKLHGIKALRECENISLSNVDVISTEFGWFSKNIKMISSVAEGEYFMLKASDIKLFDVSFKGKYSFQYIENATFKNCVFNTKDAFWHAKNVTVYDSVISGEYLAWYSENLKLVRCKISGTQPLCYCKGLVLEDCEMENTDLSFERSDVEANIKGSIVSVKNPISGYINAEIIEEVIFDGDFEQQSTCEITVSKQICKML